MLFRRIIPIQWRVFERGKNGVLGKKEGEKNLFACDLSIQRGGGVQDRCKV